MAKVLVKSPLSAEALQEVFQEIGAKEGFTMEVSDGNPIVVESEVAQNVLDMAVAQAKTRKTKRQADEDLRKTMLAKTSWSTADRDQIMRLILERMVI